MKRLTSGRQYIIMLDMNKVTCPNKKCRHQWVPRVPAPSKCPMCFKRLQGFKR